MIKILKCYRFSKFSFSQGYTWLSNFQRITIQGRKSWEKNRKKGKKIHLDSISTGWQKKIHPIHLSTARTYQKHLKKLFLVAHTHSRTALSKRCLLNNIFNRWFFFLFHRLFLAYNRFTFRFTIFDKRWHFAK